MKLIQVAFIPQTEMKSMRIKVKADNMPACYYNHHHVTAVEAVESYAKRYGWPKPYYVGRFGPHEYFCAGLDLYAPAPEEK